LNSHASSAHFEDMQRRFKDVLLEPLEISLIREIGEE